MAVATEASIAGGGLAVRVVALSFQREPLLRNTSKIGNQSEASSIPLPSEPQTG